MKLFPSHLLKDGVNLIVPVRKLIFCKLFHLSFILVLHTLYAINVPKKKWHLGTIVNHFTPHTVYVLSRHCQQALVCEGCLRCCSTPFIFSSPARRA